MPVQQWFVVYHDAPWLGVEDGAADSLLALEPQPCLVHASVWIVNGAALRCEAVASGDRVDVMTNRLQELLVHLAGLLKGLVKNHKRTGG